MRARAPINHPQEAEMAKIALRCEQLARLRTLVPGLETDHGLALRVGMHPAHVSRILRGAPVGAKFIAGLIDVFGIEFFQDLFKVIPDDGDGNGAAA